MKKQARAVKGITCVLARILLCSAFLATMLGYTSPDVHDVARAMSSKVPLSSQGIFVAMAISLIAGTVSIVLGYRARIGAIVLFLFAAITTWLFQGFTFWNVVNGAARQDHVLHLVLNLSLMGAMLIICANGPGEMSFDTR